MMFVTLKLPLSIYKAPLSQQAPEVQPEPDFGADFAKAMKAQIWGVWLIIILWKLDVIYKIMIIMISKSEFVCNRVLIIILWNLDVNWCDLLMLFLAHIIIYIYVTTVSFYLFWWRKTMI